MTEQRPKVHTFNRMQTDNKLGKDIDRHFDKLEKVESDTSSVSSNLDEEYQADRYTFLEIGRILSLSAPVFSEDEAALIVKNILIGLSHIHALNLVHRDIKPENILVLPQEMATIGTVDTVGADPEFTERQRLKIVDFGFSARFKPSKYEQIGGNIGTTLYMAPEQITNSAYGRKIDIYATGITMFYLLAGHHPLYEISDSFEEFKKKVTSTPPESWVYPPFISALAKDLIMKLCNLHQSSRCDANTALEHPWITRELTRAPDRQALPFHNFKAEQKLLRSVRALTFLAIVKKNLHPNAFESIKKLKSPGFH
jgi:serine/threonine protein kinase